MPASERDEAEAAAMARILDRMHASDRDEVRRLLESGLSEAPAAEGAILLVSSSDPEMASDMSIIASVRAARGREPELRAEALREAMSGEQHVRVLVALVPHLPQSGPRAIVERRPGDEGTPLLLLRDDATPEDFLSGMKVAALSVRTHGRAPDAHTQLVVDHAPAPAPEGVAAYLRLLREANMRDIEGVGTVRAMIVRTDPQALED